MSEHTWKPGDVVQVKSGGPAMTVAGDDGFGRIICEWFDGKKQMSGTFNSAVLKQFERPRAVVVGVGRR